MKIRNGFVSNSSTASFIVTFSANNVSQEDIEQIIKLSESNRHSFVLTFRFSDDGTVEGADRDEEERDWSVPIEKNMFGFYDVELSTVMFNDWMDVDCWTFARMLAENKNSKLSLVHIVQTEKEYADCYEYVTFDKMCWDSHNSRESLADKRRQREIEKEYDKYLENLKERDLL
jgi:hypothetical protein